MQTITLQKRKAVPRKQSPFQGLCDCAHCPLYPEDERSFKTVPGAGNQNARIIFVGEAPGNTEVVTQLPFTGESGRLLDHTLTEVGLERRDVYCTNALLCRPPDNSKPTVREITACNQRLKQEILSLPNRHVIVIVGTSAVKAVTGKNDGVTTLTYSTQWSEEFNCFLVFSVHPAACLRNPDPYQDVLRAFRHARDLLTIEKGPIAVPPILYTLEDVQEGETFVSPVTRCVSRLYKLCTLHTDVMSCDLETTGLDWWKDTIEQVGIGFRWQGKDRAYLIPATFLVDPRVRASLKRLLARRDVKWAYHNGKFDLQFLWQAGFAEAHLDIDTMLLHKSLDERQNIHKLGQVVAKYYADYDYKEDKDKFTDPVYHAKDCVYTLRLGRDELPKELAQEPPSHNGYPNPQYRHDHVLAPVWNDIADIEVQGIPVDREAALALAKEMGDYPNKELGGTLLKQKQACQLLAGHTIPEEKRFSYKVPLPLEYYKVGERKGQPKPRKEKTEYTTVVEQHPINLSSPQQIGTLLYTVWNWPVIKRTSKGQPSVDEETLVHYMDVLQNAQQRTFLEALLDYRKALKLYSTYVVAAYERSAWDGSLHTHFGFGPVTGRPSSEKLNIQNIPSDDHGNSPIKKLYIAPEGYWFLEADYAQQEMRMAAFYAHDIELLKACMESDFHAAVARMVFAKQFAEIDACGTDMLALERLITSQTTYRGLAAEHAKTPLSAQKLTEKLIKLWRFRTKSVNFGKLYGQTPIGLYAVLVNKGVDSSVEETTEYHRAWNTRFEATTRWLAKQRHDIIDYGRVDTPLGHRRRKFLITDGTRKETENQAMNSPIQCLSSDMTMLSVIDLHEELQKRKLGRIAFFVHDNIAFFIKKERLQEGARLVKHTMEHALDPLQDNDFYVPFPVDMKYGRGWGELQELKGIV